MSYTVVIPARYGSQRFPGKLLACLHGRPIIEHVFHRANQSQAAHVMIATDDQRIATVAKGFGADVCMTATSHQSGTERIAEVIKLKKIKPESIIVNVQGDEPFIEPDNIDQVAMMLERNRQSDVASLYHEILNEDEYTNPNVVKVVLNASGSALYFSRAPIPFARDPFNTELSAYRHIGMYAYRAGFINRYLSWSVSPIEQIECLEQLRILWHGTPIQMEAAIADSLPGIDTPEDLARYEESKFADRLNNRDR